MSVRMDKHTAFFIASTLAVAGLLTLPLWPSGLVFAGVGADAVSLVLPHFAFQADALAHGHWPLWNPYALTGLPELAGAQWGAAYPPQLVLLPLFGAAAYIKLTIALHFVLLALAARWLALAWLRLLALPADPLALTFAAQCIALSGFWTGHLYAGHIQFLQALPWLVALLAAGIETLAGLARGPMWVGLSLALAVLAGGPQLAPFGLMAGAPLWLWAAWLHRAELPGRLAWLVAALAVAVCLAAVQILPSLELTAESLRARVDMAGHAAAFAYRAAFLPALAIPDWLAGHGVAEPWEFDARVGVPVLALAGAALTQARLRAAVLALLAGCLALLLLAGALGLGAQAWLPGFSLLRVPARMVLGVVVLLPLAAATALAAIPTDALLRRRAVIALALGAVGLLLTGLASGPGVPLGLMLLWTALTGLLLRGARPGVAAVGWLVLLLLALPNLRTKPDPLALPDVALGVNQAALEPHQRALWRTPKRWNTGMAVGVRQLAAYEPFAPWRTALLMKTLATGSPAGPWPRMFAIWPESGAQWSPVWDAFAVSSVVQPAAMTGQSSWERTASSAADLATWRAPAAWPRGFWTACATSVAGPQAALAELTQTSPPRAWVETAVAPCAPGPAVAATWLEDAPERLHLHVDAPTPGWLVVQDLAYPGWTASVNGLEVSIIAANGAGRAVAVPAGAVDVVMAYAPESVAAGLRLSGAGVLLWGLLAWLARRRIPTPG